MVSAYCYGEPWDKADDEHERQDEEGVEGEGEAAETYEAEKFAARGTTAELAGAVLEVVPPHLDTFPPQVEALVKTLSEVEVLALEHLIELA